MICSFCDTFFTMRDEMHLFFGTRQAIICGECVKLSHEVMRLEKEEARKKAS